MARVSVVIPVYNIEEHLRQCLDSVRAQTLDDIEIICVDDGSTDGSPEILARYAAEDSRFRIVTQQNAGPGAARNAGLALASGEYVIFLDSDDWFEADFLQQMTDRAVQTGADVTICRGVEFDTATGREYPSEWMLKTQYLPGGESFSPREAADHVFQFTYGWPWDKLYRLDYIRREGITYPTVSNSEDLVFVFPSIAAAGTVTVLERVLVHHRVNRGASVSNASRNQAPEQPYAAMELCRQELEKRGLYGVFQRSFLAWAMEFSIWNVANIRDGHTRKALFLDLKRVRLPQMASGGHSAAYCGDRATYAKYLLVRYAPYPVFNIVLAGYKAYKRRKQQSS